MDRSLPVLALAETASAVHNSCLCGWFGLLRPARNAAAAGGVKDGESN